MNKMRIILSIFLIVGIVFVSGCTSSEEEYGANLSPDEIKANATSVTILELYNDNGSLVNKSVKVTGTVLNYQESGLLHMWDSNYEDIIVHTNGNNTVYEGDSVTVYGVFIGPEAYNTATGSQRTVPTLYNAWIE